ncbi:MAG: hypothetical protein RI947_459 [Candidatus Parcubacteria bacterium]|jgi:geranylgeranyl diphosphate synthase type I
MTLQTYIAKKREEVKQSILSFIEHKLSIHNNLPYYKDTLERLKNFVPQGKLLRGVLAMCTYEMFNGSKDVHILDVASAMEFNQSSLLIHDDIMDQDTVRRGNKTMYAQYMDQTEGIINPLLYGQSMAICVADTGFFFASELLLRSKLEHNVISVIMEELQLVCAAQMSDVHLAQSTAEPTYEEIMNVYRYKTGRYTFALPLRVGALAAKANDSVVNKVEQFGETLGIIFQLRDDEIKLFGSQESTGTSIASDIRENKKTLIRHLLYKQATQKEKQLLNTLFGKTDVSIEGVDAIKMLINKHGILEQIHTDIHAMTKELTSIVETLAIETSYRILLQEFIEYNLNRTR